jgi:hypothetical protein
MEITLVAITAVSVLVAIAATTVAWRASREQRLRSEARIAALSADLDDGPDADLSLRETPAPSTVGPLFAPRAAEAARPRFAAVVAAGALIVGTAVSMVVVFGGSTARQPAAPRAVENASASEPQPLELVALTHEREDDRLTVRGVVRNPAPGSAVNGVGAVVLLYDRDGGFVASARAEIDSADLTPGREAAFAVTVPASDVARYRVSFRTADRVVPHVDTRKS